MKCTKIILSGLVVFVATANAMPTPEELKKVEPLVVDLMRADQAALKSGKKTRESIKLSPKTKRVIHAAFRGCALKTAKIPEGIEEIEPWTLLECPYLESIEFPKSLTHLGHGIYYNRNKLKRIVFNGDAPQIDTWGKSGFWGGVPENLVIEVRKGTKGWKSPDSTELPERWPTNQSESRPIRYIE